jgi:hypothetical protein
MCVSLFKFKTTHETPRGFFFVLKSLEEGTEHLMKHLFLVGLGLLGHALYVAFSMQEALQAHHHSASGGLAFVQTITGASSSQNGGASLPLWVVMEVLVGFVLAIIGYVTQAKLQTVRLSDHQATMRYEHAVFTDFIHFNHRGAVVSARQ